MSLTWLSIWPTLLLLLAAAGAVLAWRKPAWRASLCRSAVSGLLYGLLGPPIGGLLVGLVGFRPGELADSGFLLLFSVMMSYPLGELPALVGGSIVGALRPRLGGTAQLLTAAVACGIATALFGLMVGLELRILLFMCGLGAVSGVSLEAAWMWWRKRRDTNATRRAAASA